MSLATLKLLHGDFLLVLDAVLGLLMGQKKSKTTMRGLGGDAKQDARV
jgi:hypothetical protein